MEEDIKKKINQVEDYLCDVGLDLEYARDELNKLYDTLEEKQDNSIKDIDNFKRELKFRGKYLDDTSEWLYGNYVYIEDDVFHHKIADKSGLLLDIDINTIGQYTGLKDKNGKEIYEGDIVKAFTNKKWRIGKIIYEHSGFTIDVTNNKELKYGRTSIIESLTEKIGNKWDNPELLEKGE